MIIINGSYFQNPTFPTAINDEVINTEDNNYNRVIIEQSNFEKILKLNIGRKVTLYINFNNENKTISGIVENIGNDYLIISEPSSGKWDLVKLKDISYIEFEEKINYN